MQLRPRSYRPASCCLLSVAIVLLNSSSGRPQQVLQTEWSFPTQNNPRVVISNASLISINAWDKNEVSIKAEVLAAAIQAKEVSVTSENNKLDISCNPTGQENIPDRQRAGKGRSRDKD